MSDEWGGWHIHDGKGCPCIGEYFQAKTDWHEIVEGIAGSSFNGTESVTGSSWHWIIGVDSPWSKFLEYRIRKPKGLTILESILREVEHTRTPEYTAV